MEHARSAGNVFGDIAKPANAIPGHAQAVLQLRFVVGTGVEKAVDAIRAHLQRNGFAMVEVSATQSFAASRTDFDSPWVDWIAESIRQTTGKAPAVLPNFGGSLPNDVFSDALGLPTIWVPHSYPGCSQHAPDEHILWSVTEEALASWRACSGIWARCRVPCRISRRAGHP